MKNIVASLILVIVFVLPFQVLADSDHDPNENAGNSTPVNTNSSLVHFTLDDEKYIDDIPFDTEKIYWACSFDQNCGSVDPESVTLEEENYIDDIPFNTEDHAADSIGYKNKEEEFSVTSFNLDEEEYINDIPWDTQKLFADIMLYPNKVGGDRQEGMVLVSFHYNEDGYIEVDMVNGSSDEFKNHVVETLEDIRLTRGIVSIGKEYIARFDFKLK